MPKSIFDRIVDWPYHPQTILGIAFVGCFIATMQGDGLIWAALVVAAVTAPFAALLLFLPYLATIMLLAVVLSLPSLIRAIQAALHTSAPATH
ncbi:hypothetical protein [Methylobacter tundripaludum]|uniref:Uncharacterized protein n=1 Tax=Methylobacter tundripaludum (strain ATCC BAA-1195 / DSM 17260 / SV96) TaxID=697282 RepID=G3IRG1_METTV|nr:hypothetical protein [Methylobacter tundripaludum]EGW22172.1 hypothetical protein Mettu_0973 [Methylobacter tundripaludum SV96]